MDKIVVNPMILEALTKSKSVVTSVSERYKYVKGQRTNEPNGFRVTVVCIEGNCIGETFSVNITENDNLKPQMKVTCVIDTARPYVRTTNKGFSSIEVSLSGRVMEVK